VVPSRGHSEFQNISWLPGRVESSISDLEFPTVDNTTVVCFESHLIAGLGLPPSKFLISILNFLKCELVHLNLNAIIVLSYFIMLCECCLGIPPDTSLFYYFYAPVRYDKQVFSEIGLTLCTTAGNNTWMPLSRAARKAPPESGSLLICRLTLNG
jgi:hypothetical protein